MSIVFTTGKILKLFYWTKMYPMALMYLSPLSGFQTATLPHELLSSCTPAPPKPILESHWSQVFKCSLETIPILVLVFTPSQLKPSMLQCSCKEACEPISVFHVSRPNEVLRYFPSARALYTKLYCKLRKWRDTSLPSFSPKLGYKFTLVTLT